MTRAGIASASTTQEKKNILNMAVIGGTFGGKKPLGVGTKEDLIKEKQAKDKAALQENSLVAYAMNEQSDLYAPNTLPFFSQNPKSRMVEQPIVPVLTKEESAASMQLKKEQSSNLKL